MSNLVGSSDAPSLCLPTAVIQVPTAAVRIGGAHRDVDESVVAELVDSMSAIGLKSPITVRAAPDLSYDLVVGHHRLKAALRLGWRDISAFVHNDDEKSTRRWQISENLHRKELNELERAACIADWIKLAAIEGQVVPKSGPGRPEGAIAKAARTLPLAGKTQEAREKSVRRALQIANIADQAKLAAKQAGLDDNQSALLEVSRQRDQQSQLSKVGELAAIAKQPDASDDAAAVSHPADIATPTLAGLIARKEAFDLAVLTPTRAHITLVSKDYADPDTCTKCLPLNRVMREKAAIVAVVPVSDVPIIANFLTAVCGFKAAKRPRILLLGRPSSPDISDALALVAAERGKARFNPPGKNAWTDTEALDPLSIAKLLYPDAKRGLQVFAAKNADGWTSLVGPNSWLKEPSVR